MRSSYPAVFLYLLTAGICSAQTSALTIQPSCPVAASEDDSTKVLRVTYSPQSPAATIKKPQKLVLDIGVNGQYFRNNARSIPFTRTDAGTWEATFTRDPKEVWFYLIFQVKDSASNQIDDNHSAYWDAVACDSDGGRNMSGVENQVESYGDGYQFENGIGRAVDYAKGIAIIDFYMESGEPDRSNLLRIYWDYKVRRDGNNQEAWNKLSMEITRFLEDNITDPSALMVASSFIRMHESHLSPELYPRLMRDIRAIDPDRAAMLERWDAYNNIQREKSEERRAERLAKFIQRYPNDRSTPGASAQLFSILRKRRSVGEAENLFQKRVEFDPNWSDTYAAMAALYIESGQKVDEGLKLLDKVDQLGERGIEFRSGVSSYSLVLGPDWGQDTAIVAYWRARALLLQGKGEAALLFARKASEQHKTPERLTVLAQVFEATGQKQNAVDAYLEALAQPSSDDPKRMKSLEHLWLQGGFGTKEQLDQKIKARQDELFRKANYVPMLVDRPVPDYDFTTLANEHLRAADLRDKTVVLNFWATWCSPCVPELAGFQELQRQHPDWIVAALAISSERQELDKLVKEKQLASLRIAQADSFKDAFVPEGVPVTYLIDHGRIRVVHPSAMSNVGAYFDADLTAIRKEKEKEPTKDSNARN